MPYLSRRWAQRGELLRGCLYEFAGAPIQRGLPSWLPASGQQPRQRLDGACSGRQRVRAALWFRIGLTGVRYDSLHEVRQLALQRADVSAHAGLVLLHRRHHASQGVIVYLLAVKGIQYCCELEESTGQQRVSWSALLLTGELYSVDLACSG